MNNADLLAEDPLGVTANTTEPVHSSTPTLATLSIPADAVHPKDDQHSLLFAPSQSRDSSFTQPDLSLPDIPFEDSSPAPYSPTPPASQIIGRGGSRERPDTPIVHGMLVDDENTERVLDAANNPIPNDQAGKAPEVLTDTDTEPDTTPMSEHLATSEEYQSALLADQPNLRNPLDKYMKGVMPIVHDAHPSDPLDFVDMKTIKEWDNCPNFKLIAAPFGFEARLQAKQNDIKKRILAAVAEITQSPRVGVSAPGPHDRIVKARHRTPRAFLIHGLTKDQYQILLKQKVWVSAAISFRVTMTKPTCPDLLFTLTDFSTLDTRDIYVMVRDLWQQAPTLTSIQEAVHEIIGNSQTERPPNIKAFLASVRVELMKIMEGGGRMTPHYNIYANGKYFRNHKMWTKIRGILARLHYGSPLLGSGIPLIRAHHCNICHAADHPRGFCTFPKMQGWRGPTGLPDAATSRNDDTRSTAQGSSQRR